MEDKIKSMGGRIVYNTKVDKIHFEGKTACGIEAGGETVSFDGVIVSQDSLTLKNLIGEAPKDKWILAAKNELPIQTTFAAFGIREDLQDKPYAFAFDEDITVGGIQYDSIELTNYARYPSYAPPGCSSLTCMFTGDSYDYWKEHKNNGTYDDEKQKLASELQQLLEKNIPSLKDKIEVINIATPLTYERYTGSHKGTWMTVLLKNKLTGILPKSISAAHKHLYYAGFRVKAPGGLPVALLSGFKAAQYACRDFKMVFEGKC